jgi:hypothetical protein
MYNSPLIFSAPSGCFISDGILCLEIGILYPVARNPGYWEGTNEGENNDFQQIARAIACGFSGRVVSSVSTGGAS